MRKLILGLALAALTTGAQAQSRYAPEDGIGWRTYGRQEQYRGYGTRDSLGGARFYGRDGTYQGYGRPDSLGNLRVYDRNGSPAGYVRRTQNRP